MACFVLSSPGNGMNLLMRMVLLSTLLLTSACVSMFAFPAKIEQPSTPVTQTIPALSVKSLDLRIFAHDWEAAEKSGDKILPLRSLYKKSSRARWAQRYLESLQAELRVTEQTLSSTLAASVLPVPKLAFRIQIFTNHDQYSTGILDALYLQPFSPYWGNFSARIKVWAVLGKRTFFISDEQIDQELSGVVNWLYREWSDKERASLFYRDLFEISAQSVAKRVPDLIRVSNGQNYHANRKLTDGEFKTLRTEFDRGLKSIEELEIKPNRTFVPETGFRVIQSPPPYIPRDSVWSQYLGALGGLELARREGFASVTSRARNSSGRVETLGTGDAASEGIRVALYNPPAQTGYFFPPSFGFLSQKITISGFEENIPEVSLPGSNDIPGVISDPNTGGTSDIILDPIGYNLDLKSLYLGQGIGLDLVIGQENVRFFLTGQASLNLLEARHVDIQIYTTRKEGYSFAFAQSVNASGQLGIYFPKLHFALRLLGEFEFYRDFDFPEPVDFLGAARFNSEKLIFERERIFVEGASLVQVNGQVSAIYMF